MFDSDEYWVEVARQARQSAKYRKFLVSAPNEKPHWFGHDDDGTPQIISDEDTGFYFTAESARMVRDQLTTWLQRLAGDGV